MSVAASATGSVTQVTRPMRPCQEFEHTSWVEDIIHLPGGQPALDHTKLHPIVHERPEVVYHSPSASTQSSSRLKAKDLAEQDPANFFSYFVCEEREDAADAVSEKHDQLKKVWWWWNLEYTPQAVFYQDDDDAHDVVVHKINKGHGRYVSEKHGIKVHRLVKIRMRAYSRNNKKYVPKRK